MNRPDQIFVSFIWPTIVLATVMGIGHIIDTWIFNRRIRS